MTILQNYQSMLDAVRAELAAQHKIKRECDTRRQAYVAMERIEELKLQRSAIRKKIKALI